ncbi:hypothetical protein KY362_05990 [Candidatus Woesearchaeota archaeon]|nr:hypothetical protein [Candidatus Woesearchaeota archaeon]
MAQVNMIQSRLEARGKMAKDNNDPLAGLKAAYGYATEDSSFSEDENTSIDSIVADSPKRPGKLASTLDAVASAPSGIAGLYQTSPHAIEYTVLLAGIPAGAVAAGCLLQAFGGGEANPEVPMLIGGAGGAAYTYLRTRAHDLRDASLNIHKVAKYILGATYSGIMTVGVMQGLSEIFDATGWEAGARHLGDAWNQFLGYVGGNGLYGGAVALGRAIDGRWKRALSRQRPRLPPARTH